MPLRNTGTLYLRDCNSCYGPMGEGQAGAIRCSRAPGHGGVHFSRVNGIRWGDSLQRTTPCTWSGCADPMVTDDYGVHMCPGGHAEALEKQWSAEAAEALRPRKKRGEET